MSAELYTFSYTAFVGQTLHLKINSLLFIIVRMRSDLYTMSACGMATFCDQ